MLLALLAAALVPRRPPWIEAAAKQKPTPILPSIVIGMPSRASSGYTPPSTTGMSSMITTEAKTVSVAGDSVVPSSGGGSTVSTRAKGACGRYQPGFTGRIDGVDPS